MNSTYRLYGTLWDHLDTSNNIKYMDDSEYINTINDNLNIFDLSNIRKINISSILSIENMEDLNALLKKLENYSKLLIGFLIVIIRLLILFITKG